MPRDEVDAAYFTLLRAREELDALRRYDEFLREEQRRLRRVVSEGAALVDQIHPRLRRAISHTDAALERALREREGVLQDELDHLPGRLQSAEEFVEECERDHARLREGG
jgi:phage shock protein A